MLARYPDSKLFAHNASLHKLAAVRFSFAGSSFLQGHHRCILSLVPPCAILIALKRYKQARVFFTLHQNENRCSMTFSPLFSKHCNSFSRNVLTFYLRLSDFLFPPTMVNILISKGYDGHTRMGKKSMENMSRAESIGN